MKKITVVFCSFLIGSLAVSAQCFTKGDKIASVNLGVGTVDTSFDNKVTFDQHISMEWGIASFADKFTLGLGFQISNMYGSKNQSNVLGKYNYTYYETYRGKFRIYSKDQWSYFDESGDKKRTGMGTATADVAKEDVSAMVTASLHFSPISKLDTYVKVGLGGGMMNWVVSDIRNPQGFSSKNVNKDQDDTNRKVTWRYSYNDLDHVKWEGYKLKGCISAAAYVGASYYFTDNFGVDAQVGMIAGNFRVKKDGYSTSVSIFTIGGVYKF